MVLSRYIITSKDGKLAVKTTTFEKYGQNGYNCYRIPCIVCSEKGTLIACCEARHGNDWGVTDITLRRKRVGDDTWSERITVADSRGRHVMNNPVMIADGDILHMIYCENYRRVFYTKSLDDGITWESAREITDVPEKLLGEYNWILVATGPGHGLKMSNGRLILPLWLAKNMGDTNKHFPTVIVSMFSDDRGESWKCGEIVYSTENFVNPNESTIAELSSGRLMINCRHNTNNDMRAVLYSDNMGQSWYGLHFDENLPDPICQGSLAQSDDGILFINCNAKNSEGRINTTVRHSSDDGKSWDKAFVVAKKGGYSDVCYCKNEKTVAALFEGGRNTDGDMWSFDLVVTEFSWDEV